MALCERQYRPGQRRETRPWRYAGVACIIGFSLASTGTAQARDCSAAVAVTSLVVSDQQHEINPHQYQQLREIARSARPRKPVCVVGHGERGIRGHGLSARRVAQLLQGLGVPGDQIRIENRGDDVAGLWTRLFGAELSGSSFWVKRNPPDNHHVTILIGR